MKIPIYLAGEKEDPLFQDELNRAMQDSLSDNGWTLPQQTTTNITDVEGDMPNGTMWYDNDTHEAKMKVNGVVIVFAS